MKKVEVFFEKLYEKNINGEVTDEWFMIQSQKYGEERMELKAKIEDAHERLLSIDSIKQNKDNFIPAVRKFMEMDKLTVPPLKELIERIEVCHIEGLARIVHNTSKSITSSSVVLRCPKFQNQDLLNSTHEKE